MDNILVGLGVARAIGDVPAERLEERIEKLAAELGFLVVGAEVGFEIAGECFDALNDTRWNRHGGERDENAVRADWQCAA